MTEHLLQLLSKKAAVCTTFLLLFGVNTLLAQSPSLDTTLAIDLETVMNLLQDAPIEGTAEAKSKPFTIILPRPDGAGVEYQVEASEIMEKSFYLNYPSIKTYTLFNKKNQAYGRMVVSPSGLHSFIVTDQGSYYINPLDKNNPIIHRVFYSKVEPMGGSCGVDAAIEDQIQLPIGFEKNLPSNGANKRTFRIAITTTGEFYQDADFGNNDQTTVAAAICQVISDVSVKYELELAVNFIGILNNAAVFQNPANDPFYPDESNGVDQDLQAAAVIGQHYNSLDYDLGHCLHNDGGGIARGKVCNSTPLSTPPGYVTGGVLKGAGWSGGHNNVTLVNGYMWHEVGHQFNMKHTFNGTGGSCTNAIQDTTSFEIGSGTTIMGYNLPTGGLCDPSNNIPSGGTADEYFHTKSLEQALDYIATISSCGSSASTGNNPPTVTTCGGTVTIPKGTPFKLIGSGSDPDGDFITYTWEQIDEDGPGTPTQGLIGSAAAANPLAPLFRSYPPSYSPIRYFPNLDLIKANDFTSSFEPLPTVARTLKFQLTGRDNKPGGGGVRADTIRVSVSGSGPFELTAPNGGQSIAAGSNYTVTWNHNGSNAFCSNVRIKLSIDGGTSFPYTLLATTPNDGSQSVYIPAGTATTSARMLVECAQNSCVVFFDMSASNFTISGNPCTPPVVNVNSIQPSCTLPTGSITVNASGGGSSSFEYSIDNGDSWQSSNMYPSLPPGDYNIHVRESQNLNCPTCANTTFTNVSAFNSYVTSNCPDCIVDTDGFESFASGQPITQLNYSSTSVTLSPGILAFHGAWHLFPGCQATFSGSSMLSSQGYNGSPSILTFSEPVFGFGGVFYDDGPINQVGIITLKIITTINDTIAVNETCNVTGDTGFLGVFSPNGIQKAIFTIAGGGHVELDNMKIVQKSMCQAAYPMNPVILNPATPPAISAPPIVTQPSCSLSTGTIKVIASGIGVLEYSVDNGTSFQANNTFSGLTPGSYNVVVRKQTTPSCTTSFSGNPVIINQGVFGCSDLTSPLNGATNVSGPVNLQWTIAPGSPISYILRVGTIPGGNDILDDWGAGNVQSYFLGVLPCNKTIYVTIKPVYSNACVMNCSEQSFSTASCPQNLVINLNPIPSGIHQAVIAISSTGRVESNSNVVFNAGNNISLDPAFEVELSGLFEADIDPSISLLPPNNTSNAKKKEKGGKFTSKSGGQIEFSAQMAKREPQKNYVIAQLVLPDPAFVSVSILEDAGSSIYETQEQLYLSKGTTIFLLDMPADSPPGEYFIKANTGDQEIIKKVVLID